MAIDPTASAALSLHRFGFGPRPGAIAAIASDPRGALLAELERPGGARLSNSSLPTSGQAARAEFEFRQKRTAARLAARAEREREKQAEAAPSGGPSPASGAPARDGANDAAMQARPNPGPGVAQQIYLEEAATRIDAALRAEIGFVERLVWFWSNHFCISADKGPGVRALAGAFEREAIRPYVLGRFADMLIAVETHPAMLRYLDNVRSTASRSAFSTPRAT